MNLKTKQVTGRRTLQFEKLEDILADLDFISVRPHHVVGNWSFGKICDHLAKAMVITLDGPPLQAPWVVRKVGPLFKKRFLNKPMPAGFQLPRSAAERIVSEEVVPDEVGIAALREAIGRSLREPQRVPNGVLGPLTREESDRLQLRHAELHLSFIVPE